MGIAMLLPIGSAAAPVGKIEGEAVDAITTDGIEGVLVCVVEVPDFAFEECKKTGSDGKYAIGTLPDGDYVVEFWAPQLGYVTQFFNGETFFKDADHVVISGGGTEPGVDAELEKGGTIEGRVTDATTGAGIEEVLVCAFSTTATGVCEFSDSAGDYAIPGLATASYKVEFWAEHLGYEIRFYNEKAQEGEASSVSVVAPDTTPGIDARLSKPGSQIVPLPPLPAFVAPVAVRKVPKPKPKPHCRKGFKKAKRHGHKVCVKAHKKGHRRRHGSG
jgi:hypothetical protein